MALDYDPAAIAHAQRAYAGVASLRGNLVALPLRSARFAAVVSLQTVEHLWDTDIVYSEIAVSKCNGFEW